MLAWSVAIPAGQDMSITTSLLVILGSSAVVALLFHRMRLAAIPAYLVTGVLIGPGVLRLIDSPDALQDIGRFAIILLLFGIGLDLHLSALRHNLARMVLAGLGSCMASILLGWPLAIAMRLPPPAALAMCMALSLSSTSLVLRVIASRRELHHASGRLALAILVLQDLGVLAMLAFLPVLAKWAGVGGDLAPDTPTTFHGAIRWGTLLLESALRIGGIAAMVVVGRLLMPRLLDLASRRQAADVLLVVGIAIALGAARLAEALGFSLEVGAFLAGFVLADTRFRHHLIGQIGPLRDLFIAVFFTTLGMQIDPALVATWWWVILLGTAMTLIVKTFAIGGVAWSLGATAGTAAAVGLSLAQAGEFSLILLRAANSKGVLPDAALAIGVAIVFLSLLVTPAMVRLGALLRDRWIAAPSAPWIRRAILRDPTVPTDADREHDGAPELLVVVAGYGHVGQRVVQSLDARGANTAIIELNAVTVQKLLDTGRRVIYGDIGNPEVLASAGVEHAHLVILTIPDDDVTARAVSAVRTLAPNTHIIARVGTIAREAPVQAAGATHAVADERASGDRIAQLLDDHLYPITPIP